MTFNKALAPLIAALVAVVIQWQATGQFNLGAEFVTAVLGVVSAGAVLLVRNLPSDPARKAATTVLLAGAAVVIQWLSTGALNVTQEFVTACLGLGMALAVYYVPNVGPLIEVFGSQRVNVDRRSTLR